MKNKRFLKTFTSLLIIVLLLTLFPTYQANAAKKKSKGYLLLVQNENGTWTNYSGVATIKKVDSKICVNPQKVANYLGFKYTQVSELKFSVANGAKKSTFTLGSKKYTYNNGTKTVNRTSLVKITGKIHYSDLKGLVKSYKYFKAVDASAYKKLGYTGVLCISNYSNVTKVPSTDKVVSVDGNKVYGNTSNVTTSGSITIDGVKVPVLENFNTTDITTNHWSNKDSSKAVSDLGYVLGDKIAKSHNDSSYESIVVEGKIVTFYIGSFNSPDITLTKDETNNGYIISIYCRFVTGDGIYANETDISCSKSALLAMSSMISTKPSSLCNTIITTGEKDSSYKGINTKTYITIDDYQIKYKIDSDYGCVDFYIKAAK